MSHMSVARKHSSLFGESKHRPVETAETSGDYIDHWRLQRLGESSGDCRDQWRLQRPLETAETSADEGIPMELGKVVY